MIREDKSYLNKKDILAIEHGFAVLDVHSLRIDRKQYTEEEKQANVNLANSVSKEEWGRHCDSIKKATASKIETLLDKLNEKFDLYQYKKDRKTDDYNRNWDLFFWCNVTEEGRDLSYVTLTLNKNRTVEQRASNTEDVLNFIRQVGYEGLDVIVQYTVKYDNEKVQDFVTSFVESNENSFVKYFGREGKIKVVDTDDHGMKMYGFFKKGARTRYTLLNYSDILWLAI